ncbi:MAG: four helix bundle protein [Chitinophagaceae bacterium]|nr:four helix bundle protein [Chitinophagaceae bacterium]
MATITKFEELEVWQLARELANQIFELFTSSEAFSRDFKLRDQINGSSGSVMDNIAEGFERSGRNEFINFLTYSKGSAGEVKSQLYRALDRKYITQEQFDGLYEKADIIGKKTGAFINYLNSTDHKGTKFKNRKS